MCILYIMLMLDAVYFQSHLCDFNSQGAWVARDTALGLCVIVLMTIASLCFSPCKMKHFYLSYTTDSSTDAVVFIIKSLLLSMS